MENGNEMTLMEYLDRTGIHCDEETFKTYKGVKMTPKSWKEVVTVGAMEDFLKELKRVVSKLQFNKPVVGWKEELIEDLIMDALEEYENTVEGIEI